MNHKLPPRTTAPTGAVSGSPSSTTDAAPQLSLQLEEKLSIQSTGSVNEEQAGADGSSSSTTMMSTPTNQSAEGSSAVSQVRDQTPPATRILETIDYGSSGSKEKGTPPRPDISTLRTLNMMNMPNSNEGDSEPPTIPPPSRNFDLTPVTRNTSELVDVGFGEGEDDDQDFLIGEHLAMPNDLSAKAVAPQPAPHHPHLYHRAKSIGHYDLSRMVDLQSGLQRTSTLATATTSSSHLEPRTTSLLSSPPPTPLRTGLDSECRHSSIPSPRSAAAAAAAAIDAPQEYLHPQLTPYTPTREELMDIGLNEAQVDQIFAQRRRSSLESSSSLSKPVPLEERQHSIPSIRMAQHVYGSKASLTDYTHAEEEDTLFRDNDDASLSSRGSLYLIDNPFETGTGESLLDMPPMGQAPILLNGMDQLRHESSSSLGGGEESTDDPTNNATNGEGNDLAQAKERRALREQNAVEWLRAVQSTSHDVFAEAASSKFLTGQPQRVMAQQTSSPSPKSTALYSSLDSENKNDQGASTTPPTLTPCTSVPDFSKMIRRQTPAPATLDTV